MARTAEIDFPRFPRILANPTVEVTEESIPYVKTTQRGRKLAQARAEKKEEWYVRFAATETLLLGVAAGVKQC